MNKLLVVVGLVAALCVYTQAAGEAKAVLDDIKLVLDNVDKLNGSMKKLIALDKSKLAKDDAEKLKKSGMDLLEKQAEISETFEKFGDFIGLPKPTDAPEAPKS